MKSAVRDGRYAAGAPHWPVAVPRHRKPPMALRYIPYRGMVRRVGSGSVPKPNPTSPPTESKASLTNRLPLRVSRSWCAQLGSPGRGIQAKRDLRTRCRTTPSNLKRRIDDRQNDRKVLPAKNPAEPPFATLRKDLAWALFVLFSSPSVDPPPLGASCVAWQLALSTSWWPSLRRRVVARPISAAEPTSMTAFKSLEDPSGRCLVNSIRTEPQTPAMPVLSAGSGLVAAFTRCVPDAQFRRTS